MWKRIAVMVAVGGLALAGSVGSASAADALNCDDFDSQAEAQAELNKDKTDPNGLDGDPKNGLACDSHDYGDSTPTPTPQPTPTDDKTPKPTPTPTEDENTKNCRPDFTYQEDAQAEYDRDRTDPHGLDGNDQDGRACEDLPSRGDRAPQEIDGVPLPTRVDTGGGAEGR